MEHRKHMLARGAVSRRLSAEFVTSLEGKAQGAGGLITMEEYFARVGRGEG